MLQLHIFITDNKYVMSAVDLLRNLTFEHCIYKWESVNFPFYFICSSSCLNDFRDAQAQSSRAGVQQLLDVSILQNG